MEENLREIQEDCLRTFLIGERNFGVGCKVGYAHERRADGAYHGQEHPAHTDATPGFRILGSAQRHETHDNMRLSEIAQAPGERRSDADKRSSREKSQGVGANVGDGIRDVVESAHIGNSHDRHGNQCGEHQKTLHHIGVGSTHKAAEESVEHGDTGDEKHTGEVILVEGRLEEFTASNHAGGDVEGEEDEDNNACKNTQNIVFIVQSVAEEHGDGHGIASDFGVAAQTGGDEFPVNPCADCQTDSNP